MTAPEKKPWTRNLRWSCKVCGLEQTIRSSNKAFVRYLVEKQHQRPCIDPACTKGQLALPVKLATCSQCGKSTARVVRGGKQLAPLGVAVFCSHRCRGEALDKLESTGGK